MQNNVTELTQKLLRSLDSNYNVIDMPSVIEIISLLEKVAITKELLETTRIGKHVNELRRKTSDDSLARRAKELVKKWRNMILPEPNGQLKSAEDKKRAARDKLESATVKKVRFNGQTSELEFSDNSNSSFKDVLQQQQIEREHQKQRELLLANSDSNSSYQDHHHHHLDPSLEEQMPKKRGRKKGSRNHRNLVDEAETSFTNKMAVSRGNAKVKTTKELVASLQNKNSTLPLLSSSKPIEDLNEKAAKLTERVSIIDQKLNTNLNRYKNLQRRNKSTASEGRNAEFPSGETTLLIPKREPQHIVVDEDVIIVDDIDKEEENATTEAIKTEEPAPVSVAAPLTLEEILRKLPPIEASVLEEADEEPEALCTCHLREKKRDFSIDDEDEAEEVAVAAPFVKTYEIVEDCKCPARFRLAEKYNLDGVTDEKVRRLHSEFIPNVNGNFGLGEPKPEGALLPNGLFINVVPNLNAEQVPKDVKYEFESENFKKYSISDSTESDTKVSSAVDSDGNKKTFREWHEVHDTTSYQGEILRILPYVVID